MLTPRRSALVAILASTAACGTSTSGPSSVGRLAVTITAPVGVAAAVTVAGPHGYSRTLDATETLTGLTPGRYTVTAAPVTIAQPIVGTITDTATVMGSPATVGATLTPTVNVAYSAGPASGDMWIANDPHPVDFVEYGATQLAGSGTPTPLAHLVAPFGSDGPKSIAFDRAGNLWTVLRRTPVEDTALAVISEYTAAQLDSAAPVPHVAIGDTSLYQAGGLAFDDAGNLWIPDAFGCEIVEYTAGQLAAASGASVTAPSFKLTRMCVAPVIGPSAVAFDLQGNLWVGDIGSNTIYQYARATLAGTGVATPSPTPVITLRNVLQPTALAFDAAGNLWVTVNDSTVFDYTPAQLAAGGNPAPATTVTIAGTHLVGLAFDNSGNLWVVDFNGNAIDELTAAQLAAGGTVAPGTIIGSNGGSLFTPTGIAFAPHSSALPLFSRRRRGHHT